MAGFKTTHTLASSVVIFESTADLSPKDLDMLGGTVALARQIDGVKDLADIPAALEKEVSGVKGKITWSLRAFGPSPHEIKNLYRFCKDYLKKRGKGSRYVGNEHKAAPAILLHDEGLIDGKGGAELSIIKTKEFLWVGRTIAAQDVEGYTKRDMKKPVRDTTVGLLPPKLAQVLLNFGTWLVHEKRAKLPEKDRKAKEKEGICVLDPFCGTGVIPMECLLRGNRVLASDVAAKAVTGCTKNLEWVRKEYAILKKDVESTVWKQDARKPFDLKPKEWPDVIVTEGSLGPALSERLPLKEVAKFKRDTEDLIEDFLRGVSRTLPGVPVVMIWPVWYTRTGTVMLEDVRENISEIGFQIVLPAGVRTENAPRGTLVYRRPDQFVGREIVILKPRN